MTNNADSGAGSLRQAIIDTNASAIDNTIDFDLPLTGGATIALTTFLPSVTDPNTVINGCSETPNNPAPCVGVDLPDAGLTAAFGFSAAADGGAIMGLAITDALTALSIPSGTEGVQVKNNYFGLDLLGTTPNGSTSFGVQILGDGNLIGGAGVGPATDRNVFADNATAVQILGGDDNQVFGNRFGVEADGTTVAANTESIEVVSNGADIATGTAIGDDVTSVAAPCDDDCNLIVATSGEAGIDLQGDAGGEAPAGATTIQGNFIGVGNDGVTDMGNSSVGIEVGGADDVTIGGPQILGLDGNVISGNGNPAVPPADGGITASTGALNLDIRKNYIGIGANGETLVPNDANAVFTSGPGVEVDGNHIGGTATVASRALLLNGGSAVVTNNTVGKTVSGSLAPFAGTPVQVGGNGNTIGHPTTGGNAITGGNPSSTDVAGIFLIGNSNVVRANTIGPHTGAGPGNSGPGILADSIQQSTIGGDADNEVNQISSNGTDAIEVIGDSSANTIARNEGSDNGLGAGDRFIDLGADGEGNTPGAPHGAIQPPDIQAFTTEKAVGLSGPGATVRAFNWDTTEGFSALGFGAGSATANSRGLWQITYPNPLVTDGIGASQTALPDGTSELTQIGGVQAPDATGPGAAIIGGPTGTTNDPTPTFTLSDPTNDPNFQIFLCAVDAGLYQACGISGSTFTTPALADGAHTFTILGIDEGANLSAPATRSFTVDTGPPETTITEDPKNKIKTKKKRIRITYEFVSSEPGQGGFQCQIDVEEFVLCTSPFSIKVRRGRHTFRVRAYDAVANADQSLATDSFKVVKKKPKR